jgi:hypothetical protein
LASGREQNNNTEIYSIMEEIKTRYLLKMKREKNVSFD